MNNRTSVLLALLLAAFCIGAVHAGQPLKPLRVAVQPFYISAQVGYIMDKGWDKEAGIEIKPVMFPSGAPMNEALAADLWDVSTIGGAFVFGVVNYDAKVIGSHIDGTGGNDIYVRADSPIAKVKGVNPQFPNVLGDAASVKGAMLLQTTGTTSQLAIVKWLEILGVKESDVSVVHLEFPQAYQAFQIGEGQAASLVSPYSLQADANPKFAKAAALGDLGTHLYEEIVASEGAYEKKQDELTIFLKLIYRANDELQADPAAKVANVKKWYERNGNMVSEETARQECELKPYVTSAHAKALVLGDYEKTYGEFMVRIDKIQEDQLPTLAANVKPELLKKALE